MIKNIKRIGPNEFDEYDWDRFEQLDADEFIYYYTTYSYEGDGFAIWVKDGKWAYHELSHCSCFGPTDNLMESNKMKVTKDELKNLLNKNYQHEAKEIIEYINNN